MIALFALAFPPSQIVFRKQYDKIVDPQSHFD